MDNLIKLKIEKLALKGYGVSSYNGKKVFCWNALPGEEVEAQIIKQRKGVYEAIARNILKPSPDRVAPPEDHFLSCSPWSIMSREAENRNKSEIAAGLFATTFDITTNNVQTAYRNKMEFSFVRNADNKISLAFFERSGRKRIPIEGCVLATDEINTCARKIVNWLNTTAIDERSLKSLILRSDGSGHVIAGLFVKAPLPQPVSFPDLDETLAGFYVYLSNPECPASVVDGELYSSGKKELSIEINGKSLSFGLNSFFQVNVPVFKMALDDIRNFIGPDNDVIDFFCGTGTIGISVADRARTLALVDSHPESIGYAAQNVKANKINNAAVHHAASEKMNELITPGSIVIFDPPRCGLHPKTIKKILETKPKKIIYLSCNIETQAKDISLIKECYEIEFLRFYNFFPGTPHIEGLCVLNMKQNAI